MRANASAATRNARRFACMAAATLALCLLTAASLASAAQPSLDLSRGSSLKVTAALDDAGAIIDYGGIQVDAYLVANAEPTQGYDTYTYAALEDGPFANLDVAGLNEAMTSGDAAATQASQDFSQAALTAALDDLRSDAPTLADAPSVSMSATSGGDISCEATFAPLPSGLYLLVAHGTTANGTALSADDYATQLDDGTTATVAYSALNECTFKPVLVSLPTREASPGEALGTASGTDWLYNASALLKPQVSPRMGSLEIVKGLDRFETDGTGVDSAATFVFSVLATDVNGEKVYDDVVSLTFNQPGTKSVLIENKIPVGSTVTVTEVYSGASYTVVGASEGTAVIEADKVARVTFANTNSNTKVHGGAVTNSFTYEQDENGKDGWTLSPTYSHGAAASED